MFHHHAHQPGDRFQDRRVSLVPAAPVRAPPEHQSGLAAEAGRAGADRGRPVIEGHQGRGPVEAEAQVLARRRRHAAGVAADLIQDRAGRSVRRGIHDQRALCPERHGDQPQQLLHHARGHQFDPQVAQQVIQHVGAAQRVGHGKLGPVELRQVDAHAAGAHRLSVRPDHRHDGDRQAGGAAITTPQPAAPMTAGGTRAERIERREHARHIVATQICQDRAARAAQQRPTLPAERTFGTDMGQPALGIGLEHQRGGGGGQVAPGLRRIRRNDRRGVPP